MCITFVTTDACTTVYDTERVKTLSQYVVIDDNSTINVPVSSSEFYLVDMYLNGTSIDDTIENSDVSAVMMSLDYAHQSMVPDSFIDDVRKRLSTILYAECMLPEIEANPNSECPNTVDMIKRLTA
jgi:hypothetical protein